MLAVCAFSTTSLRSQDGQMRIDGATGGMTVSLKDLTGQEIYKVDLAPDAATLAGRCGRAGAVCRLRPPGASLSKSERCVPPPTRLYAS